MKTSEISKSITEKINKISKDFKIPNPDNYKQVEILIETHTGDLIDIVCCPIADTYKTIADNVNLILNSQFDFYYEPIRLKDNFFDKIIEIEELVVIDSQDFYSFAKYTRAEDYGKLEKLNEVGTFTLRHKDFNKKRVADDLIFKSKINDYSDSISSLICEKYDIKKEMLSFLINLNRIEKNNNFSKDRGFLSTEKDIENEINFLLLCHNSVLEYVTDVKIKGAI